MTQQEPQDKVQDSAGATSRDQPAGLADDQIDHDQIDDDPIDDEDLIDEDVAERARDGIAPLVNNTGDDDDAAPTG
jgi:hypothetical protein